MSADPKTVSILVKVAPTMRYRLQVAAEVVPCPSASGALVFCSDRLVANLGHIETPAQDSNA